MLAKPWIALSARYLDSRRDRISAPPFILSSGFSLGDALVGVFLSNLIFATIHYLTLRWKLTCVLHFSAAWGLVDYGDYRG